MFFIFFKLYVSMVCLRWVIGRCKWLFWLVVDMRKWLNVGVCLICLYKELIFMLVFCKVLIIVKRVNGGFWMV